MCYIYTYKALINGTEPDLFRTYSKHERKQGYNMSLPLSLTLWSWIAHMHNIYRRHAHIVLRPIVRSILPNLLRSQRSPLGESCSNDLQHLPSLPSAAIAPTDCTNNMTTKGSPGQTIV